MKVKTINFQLLKGISFLTSTSCDSNVLILVMFEGADQSLEICLDLQFSLFILTILADMHKKNYKFIGEALFVALF